MSQRMVMYKVIPEGQQAVLALQKYVQANVDPKLHELVKTRASQINGCAFCLDMHTREAREQGENERRLFALSAWWESPFFTERECAALALTDALTALAGSHFPEEVFENARKHFSEAEVANLILAIAQINVWNRIAISTGSQPPALEPAANGAHSR